MAKIFIIIPAYNEAHAIGGVVRELKKAGYTNIVVIDDGSADKTFQEAQAAGAIALQHIINRGQGAALRTGLEFAVSEGADILVTFDADGQHRVVDIPAMIAPVLKGKVEMTLGSRFLVKKSNIPIMKRFALKAGTVFNWLMYGILLSDAHNGFRAISRSAAKKLDITADKMEHASEILDDIRKKNISFQEVPVVIKYTRYAIQKGQSPWKSIPLGFKIILRKMVRILK
jgi:glycosyltransferase involved in cell wall biosynthesis